jgi:hypothetical protein
VVGILDDYSRAAVAARVFPSDSSYHSLLTLRQAMERYGRPRVLYTDNDSKFRLTRYQRSRFFTYREETLQGLVETEVGRALRELDVQLLSHLPGNAQAKGKIERFFRFHYDSAVMAARRPLLCGDLWGSPTSPTGPACVDTPQGGLGHNRGQYGPNPATPGLYARWTASIGYPDYSSGVLNFVYMTSCKAIGQSYTDADGDCIEAADTDGNGVVDFGGDALNSARATLLAAGVGAGKFGKTMDFDLNGNGIVAGDFGVDTLETARFTLGILPCQ